jgi:hypothetical protein
MEHEGVCICGEIRYAVTAKPHVITICHCRFCQRATGAPYLVEPIFSLDDLAISRGAPKTFDLLSAGSGKKVTIHFCAGCGTKLYLTLERFPGLVGVYAGTFDDPSWIELTPDNAWHQFLAYARPGTVIPAGFATYREHRFANDGSENEATTHGDPYTVDG